MDTNTNTIEHVPNMSNASETTNTPPNGNNVSANASGGRDQYGRDAAERTVELKPRDAELVNQEVIAGRHQTYEDALSHLINHGVTELTRTRNQREKDREARKLKSKVDGFNNMLALNPALIADPVFQQKFVAAMFAQKTAKQTLGK